jgi:hypothetical protein
MFYFFIGSFNSFGIVQENLLFLIKLSDIISKLLNFHFLCLNKLSLVHNDFLLLLMRLLLFPDYLLQLVPLLRDLIKLLLFVLHLSLILSELLRLILLLVHLNLMLIVLQLFDALLKLLIILSCQLVSYSS